MRAFMNNINGRRHENIYGQGAFFDLDLTDGQAKMIPAMIPEMECIVASYGDKLKSTVVFTTHVFLREAKCASERPGETCRVFFGRLIKTERMSKMDAKVDPRYAPFFNKLGHFKQPSAFYWPPRR